MRMFRRAARDVGVLLLSAISLGHAQFSPRIGRPGQNEGDLFGTSVASAGDVDGDGYPDILVGSGAWAVRSPDDPSIYVLSVRTGKVLFAVGQGTQVDRFGNRSVCGPGDLNKDGHPDFVLVAWQSSEQASDYFVTAYSGADGTQLWAYALQRAHGIFGISLVVLPDADGDHIRDLAVGMVNRFNATDPGRVLVLSGRSGCLLAETREDLGWLRWEGSIASFGDLDGDGVSDLLLPVVATDHARYGGGGWIDVLSGLDLHRIRRYELGCSLNAECTGLGDVNADGVPDLLVSGSEWAGDRTSRIYAQVLSGRDGSLLSWFANPKSEGPKSDAQSIADVDGDGLQDIVLSQFGIGSVEPGVRVLSGWDAHPIRWMPAPTDRGWPRSLGYAVADGGDVDRDGIPDLVLGTACPEGDEDGYVDVCSGKTGMLIRRWSRADLATAAVDKKR